MISVDISAIEELKQTIKKAATDSDETLALLKRTLGEMQDDLEFMSYIQSEPAIVAVLEAINNLSRTNERLSGLKDILLTVDDEYSDVENENVNAVRRMASYLEKLQTNKQD